MSRFPVASIFKGFSQFSTLNGRVSYLISPLKIAIWAPIAITLTTNVDTMEPTSAPFVLNFSDTIPMVNKPKSVPLVMPEKAIPIENTPPSFSTMKTMPKQTQPRDEKMKIEKLFHICTVQSARKSKYLRWKLWTSLSYWLVFLTHSVDKVWENLHT